ncbi:hypothetical protein BDP55DRAFT_627620 [Colletotrichum godetiae]|uniref:Uncharacterized protein n=1 Tax=Colletotrichum godetiae TaxID=1209918 RepID=A0AAJ0AV39_9PEZI|nr:uncharacterized protein BDP55DRAFT_627620 [Colletotrichum godetiae]KAK1690936.1 hypothetical protein BDP55DRAFT_627620 [Colletotrichum godetiae]
MPHRTTASRQRPSASAWVSLQTFDSSHSSATQPLPTSSGPVSGLLAPESDPEPTIGERCVLTAVPQASEAKRNEIFRTRLVYSTNRLEDVWCLTGMTLASERVPADGRSFEPSTPRDDKQRCSEEGDPSLRRGQAPKNSVMQVGESQLPRGQEVAVRDVPAREKPHVRALCCFKKMPAGNPLPVTAQVQLHRFEPASRICALNTCTVFVFSPNFVVDYYLQKWCQYTWPELRRVIKGKGYLGYTNAPALPAIGS